MAVASRLCQALFQIIAFVARLEFGRDLNPSLRHENSPTTRIVQKKTQTAVGRIENGVSVS